MTKKSYLHSMKTGDLRPYLQIKVFDPPTAPGLPGLPRDLTEDIVTFNMKDAAGNLVINDGVMTPILAAQGLMEYRWQEGETDAAGVFRAEVVINGIDTFPKDGYITVQFTEDLD